MANPPTCLLPLLLAAAARRSDFPNPATDSFRILDGEGDGLPGIEIDEIAGRWLVSTRRSEPLPNDLAAALHATARTVYLKHLDDHEKTSPSHFSGPPQDDPFSIRENNIHFEVSFQSGYSQGIFLDQRENRLSLRQRLESGKTLLNTFAYTGAFSVAAALAGATTTTLDLSQPYLDWARRNFELNTLNPAEHFFCKGDTFHWLKRFAKQGRRFDAIVLDPPTFSRTRDGRIFRVETDYTHLARLASACLEDDGILLACTNCRQLSEPAFIRQIREGFNRPIHIEPSPMPGDFTAAPYLKSLWIK